MGPISGIERRHVAGQAQQRQLICINACKTKGYPIIDPSTVEYRLLLWRVFWSRSCDIILYGVRLLRTDCALLVTGNTSAIVALSPR